VDVGKAVIPAFLRCKGFKVQVRSFCHTARVYRAYHLYLTNISPDQLAAEDVALLYGARWSIELVFKELKRLYKLDVISSGEDDVVEALVLVAMLTLVVSHRLLNHMRLLAPEKSERFTPLRWAETKIIGQFLSKGLPFTGYR